MFNFSSNQKEKIYILNKNCIDYLQKKYNIFINDLIQNENIWSKWKEKNCPEFNKIINLKENKDNIDMGINTKIQEVKSLFNNYNINYIINSNSNFINNIKSFKETKLDSIKFSESIEGLNSEVPFFGTYLEQIYKDLDPEEEEENTKERVLNNMPSFSWKFLRLLSEGDISKINAEEVYKLLSISEDYYKNFAPKDNQVKFNFKILTPPPKIELKPKEEIPLPKELLEKSNNEMMNLKQVKEETSEEETNNNKPVISLPIELIEKEKEIINNNNISNNSNTKNNIKINEIKITPKKEEVKEMIRLPSNLKLDEITNKEENEKNVSNISKINNEIKEKVKEKETNMTIKEIENEKQINNNYIKKENLIKESISLPKEIEKTNTDKNLNSEGIKNLNIKNIEINKCDNEKKKELDDKFQMKKFKEEINIQNNINNNNNQAINSKQNSDINVKSNNIYNKETEIIKKESKEISKSIKMSDSTIPAGIINISKDSKNPSLISKESKSLKIENINISKEIKNDINLNSKMQKANTIINNNNKISNNTINKNIKENINNKNSNNSKVEINNFHNNSSKVFTDRKSPDKNLLNNISSGNKINNNGNNINRSSISLNKNRQEIKTNHYDNKYNNKYENKYSNKNDNANYDSKYNNKYDNKFNDKYINKYDNNKYDYKNDNRYDNKYGDKYNNNYNYKYENNNNYKYEHYDNRYRYDNNKGYDRSQEKDNHFINKKRYNDDKYDNYMSSSKKRK